MMIEASRSILSNFTCRIFELKDRSVSKVINT